MAVETVVLEKRYGNAIGIIHHRFSHNYWYKEPGGVTTTHTTADDPKYH